MNLYLDDDDPAARCWHIATADARHLLYAVQSDLELVTKNHDDFEDLHDLVHGTNGEHPGILVVRSDNDASRDMKDQDVARAIVNLKLAGVPIANEFHILNHWR